MPAEFGVFSPVFESPHGYLALLHLSSVDSPAAVRLVRQCAAMDTDRSSTLALLSDLNWRSTLVAAVATAFLPVDIRLNEALWHRFDSGSWVAPQIAVILALVDPEFQLRARQRLEARCPVDTSELRALDAIERHSAAGPAGATERSASSHRGGGEIGFWSRLANLVIAFASLACSGRVLARPSARQSEPTKPDSISQSGRYKDWGLQRRLGADSIDRIRRYADALGSRIGNTDMHRLELKIPPLLVWLVLAGAMFGVARTAPGLSYNLPGSLPLALVLGVIGGSVAAGAIGIFRRRRTTVNPITPSAASSVVCSGAYRFSRNPMYLGFLLILAGWAVYLSNGGAVLMLPVFVGYLTRFQIKPEERALLAKFGPEYSRYMARVRSWV